MSSEARRGASKRPRRSAALLATWARIKTTVYQTLVCCYGSWKAKLFLVGHPGIFQRCWKGSSGTRLGWAPGASARLIDKWPSLPTLFLYLERAGGKERRNQGDLDSRRDCIRTEDRHASQRPFLSSQAQAHNRTSLSFLSVSFPFLLFHLSFPSGSGSGLFPFIHQHQHLQILLSASQPPATSRISFSRTIIATAKPCLFRLTKAFFPSPSSFHSPTSGRVYQARFPH